MFNRLAFVVAFAIFINAPRVVAADPITYDFTGAFKEPFDGSTAFSGSLTIDATPPINGQPFVTESGSDVSITLNAGGQVYNFANSPQNPYTTATFTADEVTASQSTSGPFVAFNASGSIAVLNGTTTSFGMTLFDYGLTSLPANLASLSLPVGTSSLGLQIISSPDQITGGGGPLTSIEIVSTPEPSTLAVFGVMGIAALLRRRYRGLRDREVKPRCKL